MDLISKQYISVREEGKADYRDGKELSDDPYTHFSDISLSSWWQAGYLQEKQKND